MGTTEPPCPKAKPGLPPVSELSVAVNFCTLLTKSFNVVPWISNLSVLPAVIVQFVSTAKEVGEFDTNFQIRHFSPI